MTHAAAAGIDQAFWIVPARAPEPGEADTIHRRSADEGFATAVRHLLASPEFAHLGVHRVRRPAEAERLLARLASALSASSVWPAARVSR